jgi:redox-sensitive bicupin YhaK (pirin superfamily)
MSVMPHVEPECLKKEGAEPAVELDIEAHTRDLGGGFTVRRLLPSPVRRMVGPFIFVDHMGPVHLAPGLGLDVRPHPHINLATVTYLFEGDILHRDSLGTEQLIRPGAVNWMTAGRGIVHSERSPAAARQAGPSLHGMQMWVALPTEHEEVEPSFAHHPADTIPAVELPGARLRIVAGAAYGKTSPVKTLSPLFYVEAQLDADAELPLPEEYLGRAAYVVKGVLSCAGKTYGEGSMIVFRAGTPASITARAASRVMLLGGAPLDGERYVYWNFVSSSQDRIERAKDDWRKRRFPSVPHDDAEFIPLPSP